MVLICIFTRRRNNLKRTNYYIIKQLAKKWIPIFKKTLLQYLRAWDTIKCSSLIMYISIKVSLERVRMRIR